MTQPIAQVAYYARPTDDLLSGATVTSADADPEYPPENLVSELAANPAKLLTTSGRFIIQAASVITPIWLVLVYQYLDSSLAVSLEANSSNSWGSPPFVQALTIPGKRLDGPSYQPWTYNVAALILGSPMPSYEWWSLNITGTNSQAVAVGRMLLLPNPRTLKLLVGNMIDEGDDYEAQIVLPTELGVKTVYELGGPQRSFAGVTPLTDATGLPLQEAQDFRDLRQTVNGQVHPFILWPFGQSGEPWLVDFTTIGQTRRHDGFRVQHTPFSVREVSRGLPWP